MDGSKQRHVESGSPDAGPVPGSACFESPTISDRAITVENLTKVYKLYDNPIDRLKESLHPFRRKYHHDFYALKDVGFTIARGETVGIVGKNGSGKSTLLKILAGVLTPSGGKVVMNGKVSALLELGTGFNPELTGLENVYFSGTIMGYSKEELDAKIDEILSFADIGRFVHQPVKTYSSGMYVRLAFAVAISVDPDILIVDEALAVGDVRFQQKCHRRMSEIKKQASILLVTHDLSAVRTYCDQALWLDEGRLRMSGTPDEVSRSYIAHMFSVEDAASESTTEDCCVPSEAALVDVPDACESMGSGEVLVTGCGFISEKNQLLDAPRPGAPAIFAVRVRTVRKPPESRIIIGLTIRNRLGETVLSMNNLWALNTLPVEAPALNSEATWTFRFRFPDLNCGEYTVSPAVAVGTQNSHHLLHWVHDALVFKIPREHEDQLPGHLLVREFQFQQLD